MGKYLKALKIFYLEDKNDETPINGTDKTDRSPFVGNVGATSEDINDFSSSDDPDSVPFTDHEIAEHKIDQLTLHDDRVFLRRCLIGVYGSKRLDIVNGYLEQWRQGSDAEPQEIKKNNSGRYRANVWLRDRGNAKT